MLMPTRSIRLIALFMLLMVLTACSTAPPKPSGPVEPPRRQFDQLVQPGANLAIQAHDPWEPMNRRIYKFNARFDELIYLPIVRGYKFITPVIVQKGITNFFRNLQEITNLTNNLLQGKIDGFAITLGRLALNTTLGVAGLWDPATKLDIRPRHEDFGQTLGVWGVGPGPYFVIPVLGPSTLRDTGGIVVDVVTYNLFLNALINQTDMSDTQEAVLTWSLAALLAIDKRANIGFRYYQSGSPFEYDLIRMLYLRKRELDIMK